MQKLNLELRQYLVVVIISPVCISWTLCGSTYSPKRLISVQSIYLTVSKSLDFLFPDDQAPQLEIQGHYRLQANCLCMNTVELGKSNPIKAPSVLRHFPNFLFLLNVYLKMFSHGGEINELIYMEPHLPIPWFIYLSNKCFSV